MTKPGQYTILREPREGFGEPYGPSNYPNPGDTWRWRTSNRLNKSGYYVDRILYLPESLYQQFKDHTTINNIKQFKSKGFRSKKSLKNFIHQVYSKQEADTFFERFQWDIPTEELENILLQQQQGEAEVEVEVEAEAEAEGGEEAEEEAEGGEEGGEEEGDAHSQEGVMPQVVATSIPACLSVMSSMADDRSIEESSDLWRYAVELFLNDVTREMFMSLPNNFLRSAWLHYMHYKREKEEEVNKSNETQAQAEDNLATSSMRNQIHELQEKLALSQKKLKMSEESASKMKFAYDEQKDSLEELKAAYKRENLDLKRKNKQIDELQEKLALSQKKLKMSEESSSKMKVAYEELNAACLELKAAAEDEDVVAKSCF